MKYTENHTVGNKYRREYLAGLEALVARKQEESATIRIEFCKRVFEYPEQSRRDFCEMLGWPLNLQCKQEIPQTKKIFVATDDGISIYRTQTDIFGVPFYGMLFVKEDGKRRPLVISQHGGLGSPEVCCGIFPEGSYNYNDMTARVLAHDVNVFAPQMLLWQSEQHHIEGQEDEVPYESYDLIRRSLDNSLKQLGGSIAAFEIHCISRMLDYFDVQDYTIPGHYGMVGSSYGGFYTLYTAAVETRIKAALCCAFYNCRTKYNWTDWCWKNASNTFCDNEVAALVYPRMLHLAVGKDDDLFAVGTAEAEYGILSKNLPSDHRISFESFDGNHEFVRNEKALDQLIRELF